MKFFNAKYFLIWIALLLIFSAIVYQISFVCSDGLRINDTMLESKCGVNRSAFFQLRQANSSFCPEAQSAMESVGGCNPDWSIVIKYDVILSIIYNIAYAGIYFLRKNKT